MSAKQEKQINIFQYIITIPAGTEEGDSLILGNEDVGVITGILRKVHVNIPDGVALIAGIRINFVNKHKIPHPNKGAESYITGNNNPDLILPANLKLYEARPNFHGINNSSVNSHTFTVTLEVEQ